MGLSKSDFRLYETILKYVSDISIDVASSNFSFEKPVSNNDFPKIIKKGEIVLGNGKGYPSLEELADGFSNDIKSCKHVSLRVKNIDGVERKTLYAFFFIIYNPEKPPQFDKDKTNADDYRRSMRLWRYNNKTLIEMVKIYYKE